MNRAKSLPPQSPTSMAKDIPLVLQFFKNPFYKPLQDAYMKWVDLKTDIWVMTPSEKRVEELHALMISSSCMFEWPDGSGINLRLNLGFLPKVKSPNYVHRLFDLAGFNESEPTEHSSLCLTDTQWWYLGQLAAGPILRPTIQLPWWKDLGVPWGMWTSSHWPIDEPDTQTLLWHTTL